MNFGTIACVGCKETFNPHMKALPFRAFVANGGIDRSQDREIGRIKDEVGGLKARVGDLELMEMILHEWSRGRIRYREF